MDEDTRVDDHPILQFLDVPGMRIRCVEFLLTRRGKVYVLRVNQIRTESS